MTNPRNAPSCAAVNRFGVNFRRGECVSTKAAEIENHMNTITKNGPKSKFASYKKMLVRKSEEIRDSMSAQKAAQVVARLDVPSDEGDLSQHSHEEWIFLNRNTIETKLLREISGALHRLQTEQYGVCLECEEPISNKRLDAVPWARYCVVCQDRVTAGIANGEREEELEGAVR